MKFGLITLFPDIINALQIGVTQRALKQGLIEITCWNPRDFAADRNGRVDDSPYGGGPGMVMQVEPLRKAIQAAKAALGSETPVIYLSPQGKPLKQANFVEFSRQNNLILLCGRYEGVDERLIQLEVDEEWSIGDYILTGGELPACVIIDALARLVPGVLGDQASASQDSFSEGLLEYAQYTRPAEVEGLTIPTVLQTGDHKAIERWRLKNSLGRTYEKRPDLLDNRTLSPEEQTLLKEFIEEQRK